MTEGSGARRGIRTARGLLAALALVVVAGGAGAAAERVQFTATDGVQLVGHLDGTEGPGVVFGHMYPADQTSWSAFAHATAAEGFRTLTFDFRGYGESQGTKDVSVIDRDMEGAYRYLLGRKIRPVILVGASMGGTAALIVAARVPVAGVVTLSSPLAFRGLDAGSALGALRIPKLFIAATGDAPAAASARRFLDATPEPKELRMAGGSAHGTDLLAADPSVASALGAFLRGLVAPDAGARPSSSARSPGSTGSR
jgi:pimeloyl-ACP methyl ester carboxylesterase